MLASLLKSEAVGQKLTKMSVPEIQVFDLHLTAALLCPDLNMTILDYFLETFHGRTFEFLIAEIDAAIIVLAFSRRGRVALIDFHITRPLMLDGHRVGPSQHC
jgi:hypothetical protein